jgi:uncharacterized protein YndB with AHSA1/START domain
MQKWLIIIIVALLGVVASIFLIGSVLPQNHTASRTAQLRQPPERVWSTITGIAEFPTWRPDVKSVEMLPAHDGHLVWREVSAKGNKLTFEAETFEAPRHLVTRIADKDLPFGGSWDYTISADNGGSLVTITEHGEVYNPIFRFVTRFMSQTATIDAYLTALAMRLGDSYIPPGR